MESKNRIMKLPELNGRSILVTIIIVGALTAGNFWVHRSSPGLGYGKYENFGLTFEYPLLFNVFDAGFPDSGAGANDFMGVAEAKGVWEDVFHNYLVFWTTESSVPELEESLEGVYQRLADVGCVIDGKEPMVTMEKDGQEMRYQTITLTQGEFDFIGTFGVWYEPWSSLRANRVYVVSYITDLDAASRPQVEEMFLLFMDTVSSNSREGSK